MKKRAQYALDRLFNFFVVAGVLLLCMAYEAFFGEEVMVDVGVLCACVGILFLVGASIFVPCAYRFDSEGVSILRVFLPKERYL